MTLARMKMKINLVSITTVAEAKFDLYGGAPYSVLTITVNMHKEKQKCHGFIFPYNLILSGILSKNVNFKLIS